MIKRSDVQVNELEWETPHPNLVHIAESVFGVFAICKEWGFDNYELIHNRVVMNNFKSVEEAKQAAQDYVRDVVLSLIKFED